MINGLAKEVQKRMEGEGVRGRRLTLKVKQRKKDAKAPPKVRSVIVQVCFSSVDTFLCVFTFANLPP
jgi:hypothetical protein